MVATQTGYGAQRFSRIKRDDEVDAHLAVIAAVTASLFAMATPALQGKAQTFAHEALL